VLADFLALGTVASGGSYSLGQDKSELFLMAVDGWLDKIAHVDKLGVLNRYAVPRLFDYNTLDGITDFPRIKHSSVQKPNLPALSSYLQSLSAYIMPDPALEAELRRVANLPQADVSEPKGNAPTANPQVGIEEDAVDQADLARGVRWRAGLKPRDATFYERQFQRALREFQAASRL
jgi:hypothetical protein